MNLNEIEKYKIFETVAGSHSYGLNNEHSDIDLRGIFVLPTSFHIGLKEPPKQVADEKNDITFYELKRFFELASGCNPNIIELLYMPDDCIKKKTELMDVLIKNRSMFLSKKAFYTFSGYAHAQIKKAKGRNKWVNNPWGEERPDPMDYMWWVPACGLLYAKDDESEIFPCRPSKLSYTQGVKIAKIEHGFNSYRMYASDSKEDFFKGNQITCKSITKKEERDNFMGILTFNEVQYDADVKNWKGYWEWKKNRNDARWQMQEKGQMDYDVKNMMHCFRLILSTKSILNDHEPIVRFEGEQREFLMNIRKGKFQYEELMERLEEELASLEPLKEKSELQEKVNHKDIEKLYLDLVS
jgi:predicted nucleotidyltransferase